MANQINATTATIKTKATELKTLNVKLAAELLTLTAVELSLNAMWDGEANDAFHKAFTSDLKQINNFRDLINKYVSALNDIAAQYESAEKKNVSVASTRTYR